MVVSPSTGEGRRIANLMKTVLFVDDHPLFREGLRAALEALDPGLRVVTATDAASALAALAADPSIDLCLTDYRLPQSDGLELAREVRARHPSVAVALLSGDTSLAARARAAGAVACLNKTRDVSSLAAAIESVFNGGEVFDDEPGSGGVLLSERRREIVRCAAAGLLDKQIGAKLDISESTVRNHWLHIFAQLGVGNRTEAVAKSMRLGLI
jgi:DNA-binding NarL/FixJ family response regulator